MANPSSSHHDRDRERERVVRERSHHHHRTISSTTLLLILSLVLAVLAVMLSLPATRGGAAGVASALRGEDTTTNGAGIWGSFFNPRRSEALVSREHAVAKRESEVAQREAELLAGALVTCSPYATVTEIIETAAPVQTIYKEVVHHTENQIAVPPSPPLPTIIEANTSDLTKRIEDLIQRETKVAEREKDMSRREEVVNRREHDVQRREAWIMEQLIALGNDPQVIEEEYVINEPAGGKRKVKVFAPPSDKTAPRTGIFNVPPPSSPRGYTYAPPSPANTRPAEYPLPETFSTGEEPLPIPTTVSEIIYEEIPLEEEEETVTVRKTVRPRRVPW